MIAMTMSKKVLSYSLLPEMGSRIRELFMGGFGYVPYFIAIVYQMVGLLPRNHPYLITSNIGRYGIRHVVGQAAGNIEFKLKNIDQVVLFFAVIAGLILFVVQLLALGSALFLQPAMALPFTWANMFTLSGPPLRQDLAYMMLDMVFGVPHPSGATMGFFESCIGASDVCVDNFGNALTENSAGSVVQSLPTSAQLSPLAPGAYLAFPFPYHLGMHRLFLIYSSGLLVIALIIAGYFIVTILAETAQSGTPFGRRFNKTWAPIRIVMAFGLLMPLAVGLNSAQYLVLYAAKYGSAFASNGWEYFNTTLTTGYLGNAQSLVSVPNTPELDSYTHFMYVARVCREATDTINFRKNGPLAPSEMVQAHVIGEHSSGTNSMLLTSNYADLLTFLPPGATSVTIVFGIKDPDKGAAEPAFVMPVCGKIILKLFDSRDATDAEPGPYGMQEAYYQSIFNLWDDAGTHVQSGVPVQTPFANRRHVELVNRTLGYSFTTFDAVPLDAEYASDLKNKLETAVDTRIQAAVAAQVVSPTWGSNTPAIQNKGWAAAGIWYNKVAEMNGIMTASAYAAPTVMKYPAIMEKVKAEKEKNDEDVSARYRFKPEVANYESIAGLLGGVYEEDKARVMWAAYDDWATITSSDSSKKPSGNPIISQIVSILGVDGLYNMRENPNTHPLAMLSGIGRTLIESSILSLTAAAILTTVGTLSDDLKSFAGISAKFAVTIAMMGITVGFVLFYVIPFLPFVYFFFAFGGWVKGIFEAMVGAPLWALAHIRIDGHGMPGNAALNGYFLIFEVFLRPILIVFGLLASISIFSALVTVLNSIFTLVVENAAGYDITSELTTPRLTFRYMRSAVDQFFYTVIYAIIVYMIGMSSFKLIDNIPNNILRWMGQSVATFGDTREDPAQGMVSRATIGSQQVSSRIGGGLSSIVQAGTSK